MRRGNGNNPQFPGNYYDQQGSPNGREGNQLWGSGNHRSANSSPIVSANVPNTMAVPSYMLDRSTISYLSLGNSQGPFVHDISFIDRRMFSPGCLVCQMQFKHVYRDYVIDRSLIVTGEIMIGAFLIVASHIDPSTVDLGVVTRLYTADQFLEMKQTIGRSQDEEENFIGHVLRVASLDERALLPLKRQREGPVLVLAKQSAYELGLSMDVYEAEYQLDGKILFLYYTADSRVDYRGLVQKVARVVNTRVKMKKTNQCRKFEPHEFAAEALASG